ncbi:MULTISPECIES: bestrophin family protein [unclassified Flavobacterium]|uniref:bestrophin family protein n=1 Tax=unclassified Flavobacterium TaxID=196869 RepID=UPI002B22E602|nr:bestrophin family ion channel [Flavobacterium sp. PL02]MEA9415621.1 bestrophin family ion channel [Flavobacterium sp. PL02]
MISYNTKDWFTFIFHFHKSDTVRKLFPIMIAIAIYASTVGYLEIYYFKITKNDYVQNIPIMHGMLGFVISLLLVFRTNTAYDRWWEGRKLWGSLVNNSRNLAIKLSAMLKDENDRKFFRKFIPLYADILHKHLHDSETSKQLFEDVDLEIDHHKHKPNQVKRIIFHKINDLYDAKKISGEQLIILNDELQAFTDVCGACERIKNTPIPYSYSAFIKKFIFFYIMTLPFGYSISLGYYVAPVVVFVFYVLASLELIAEEIEDPFGDDENDLPTKKIAENIKKHVEELI